MSDNTPEGPVDRQSRRQSPSTPSSAPAWSSARSAEKAKASLGLSVLWAYVSPEV